MKNKPNLPKRGAARKLSASLKELGELKPSEDLVDKLNQNPQEVQAGSPINKDRDCPRCGDLYYDPHGLIEDQKQRAAEWEELYKKEREKNDALREALKIWMRAALRN